MGTLSVRAPIAKVGLYPVPGNRMGDTPGVDPEKLYTILLSRAVLIAASKSFRAVPITDDTHSDTAWVEFDPAVVIGCTGPEVDYQGGRLFTDVKFWHPDAIADIKAGKRRHLSIGFRASYDMTPGEANGLTWDGVFDFMWGDHVALVEEGEAGDACALPPYEPPSVTR